MGMCQSSPEGNQPISVIPPQYVKIIETWYGPSSECDRHSKNETGITKKWFSKNDEFDKMLTNNFKTDI